MAKTPTEPALTLNAFSCPHCHAFTTQYWYKAYAERLDKNKTPDLYDVEHIRAVSKVEVAGSGLHSCILVLSTAQSASALMQLAKPDPIVATVTPSSQPTPSSVR